MPIDPAPPLNDEAAGFAEQHWLEEEASFARSFVVAAIWLVAGLVATYLAASFAHC